MAREVVLLALGLAVGVWARRLHIAVFDREPTGTFHLPRMWDRVFCAAGLALTLGAVGICFAQL